MITTDIAIITLTFLCAVFLPAILVVVLRNRRQLLRAARTAPGLQTAEIAAIVAQLQPAPAADTSAAIDAISEQVSEMRKGFDWLVTDRMISEAIDMARAGTATSKITAQTGISGAELAAITKCRNH